MTYIGDSTTQRSKTAGIYLFITRTGVNDTNKIFRDTIYLRSSYTYVCRFYYEGRPLYCNSYDTAVCHYGEGNCTPAWNLLDYTLDIAVREVAAQVRRYVRVQKRKL